MLRISAHSKKIVFLLWGFAFLSYLLRVNITVAQQYLARDMSLNDIQVGYVFSAFLIGYSIFQVPAGILGDRFGPRVVLTVCGLLWGMTTLLTGLVPGLLLKGAGLALGSLLLIRFLHGMAEAATYPVAMNAVAIWIAPSRHAFISSLIFTGSTLGSAFAPPFVASLMNQYGWRATFYLSAVFPIVLATFWWRQSKHEKKPRTLARTDSPRDRKRTWHVLTKPAIFILCLSYLLYCYAISIFVYWLFKYLVDVRHLSIVNSGWANSLPWIAASIAVPVFGYISTKLSSHMGYLPARRLVATSCLLVSACLMSVGASAHSIGLALAAIAVSVALLFSTESSYWSTAIELAREDAGAASGLMNLSGNLGGVLATSAVPVLVMHFGWLYALLSGSVLAVLAAVAWFFIKPDSGANTKGT
ncbi:MAG TPA: MFS transporter [Bryobacteraceae bacterium]|nr:MFS transporter [Bryobacteraceae bacterium]